MSHIDEWDFKKKLNVCAHISLDVGQKMAQK